VLVFPSVLLVLLLASLSVLLVMLVYEVLLNNQDFVSGMQYAQVARMC